MQQQKINIHFCNTLCSSNSFDLLFKKYNVKSSNAPQNFFKLLADGLSEIPSVKVSVLTLLPVNFTITKKVIWKLRAEIENGILFEFIPIINLPILRNITSSIYVFFRIILEKYKVNERNYYIIDYLRFSINFAVKLACKLRNIKIITIVTDLPGSGVPKHSLIYKIVSKYILSVQYDYYVVVTRYLEKVVNKSKKPALIIESFVSMKLTSMPNEFKNKFQERVIIYAGGLFERYGIRTLIEAFMMFTDKDLRLWLYGVGTFSKFIEEYQKIDNRIAYKGIIPNEELFPTLLKATLLINPRPIHEMFSKYSYPSKNMEYMSTGTPLLTTRLPGIPFDHYPYIYLIDEDSVNGIYSSISNVLSKSRFELHSFGLNARQYVIKEKNHKLQAQRIIDLIK